MKTENFNIRIRYAGKTAELPVRIMTSDLGLKITAVFDGTEICYERDDHDGLRAITHEEDFDPELLYQIGKAIQEQRN